MLGLYLIRHASAEATNENSGDIGRRLTDDGRKKSASMASKLTDLQIVPDIIISSPAARALETARIFAEILGFPANQIEQEKVIYEGVDSREFFNCLDGLEDNIKTAVMVGHNPTLSEFGWYLCPRFRGHIKNAAVLGIGFDDSDWSSIIPGRGKLLFYRTTEKDR